MGTLAISISVPPSGELQTSGNVSSPTASQLQLSVLLPLGALVSVTGDVGGIEDRPAVLASEPSRMLLTSPANGQAAAVAGPHQEELAAATPADVRAAAVTSNLRARLGSVRTWMLSTAERAFFTFAASFGSAVALGGAFNISTLDATLFAAASAALAVVTAAIRSLSPPTDNATLDVVTRTGLTLLQAFAAAFVTTTAGAMHFSDWRAGALAGVAAAFTALKGTLATQLNGANATNGQRATPASLISLHLGAARKTSLPAGGLQVSAGQ